MDSVRDEIDQNAPLDENFRLIASMSRAEKRVFSLMAAMGQADLNQGYMRLFRLYNGKEAGGKEKLPILSTSSGRQLKSQLRATIFRSLRYQHGETLQKPKLEGGIRDVEMLYNRGLFHQGWKRLRQVQRAAEKAEQLELQMQCLQLEIQLHFDTQEYSSLEALEDLHQREEILTVAIQDKRKARQIFQRVYHLASRSIRVGSEERQAQIEQLNQRLARLRSKQYPDFWTNIYLYTAAGALALMERKMRAAEAQLEMLMQLWFKKQTLIQDAFPLWMVGMRSFLSFLFLDRQFDRFRSELRLFQSWPKRFPLYQHHFKFNLIDLELLYHMNTGELDPAAGLVEDIKQLLQDDGERLPPGKVMQLCYNVSMLFFLHGEFVEVNRWCRRMEMMDRVDQRTDLQEFAKLLSLVTLFERGEESLLDSRLASVQRYFKKRGKISSYEDLILKSLRTLTKGIPLLELASYFQAFHQKLLHLTDRRSERKWVGMQEMLLWTESRAQGISLKTLFRERSKEPW